MCAAPEMLWHTNFQLGPKDWEIADRHGEDGDDGVIEPKKNIKFMRLQLTKSYSLGQLSTILYKSALELHSRN